MELSGTVGILTGASRGIGVLLAERLADKGVALALAARSPEGLETTAETIRARGGRAIVVPTDVTDRGALKNLVDRTTSELGDIGLLVNNAGVEMVGYFEGLDPDQIESTIATNLTATIMLTRMVVPQMIARRRGHVCNIASMAGKSARPYGVVYSATKHGVVGFSWGLRAELAPHGVEVSVICPGYVSEVGMFAERAGQAGKVPGALKIVSPQRVADSTIATIERNRPEAVIGPPLMRVADVFHALSPSFAIAVGRRSGIYRFLRREATGDGE